MVQTVIKPHCSFDSGADFKDTQMLFKVDAHLRHQTHVTHTTDNFHFLLFTMSNKPDYKMRWVFVWILQCSFYSAHLIFFFTMQTRKSKKEPLIFIFHLTSEIWNGQKNCSFVAILKQSNDLRYFLGTATRDIRIKN